MVVLRLTLPVEHQIMCRDLNTFIVLIHFDCTIKNEPLSPDAALGATLCLMFASICCHDFWVHDRSILLALEQHLNFPDIWFSSTMHNHVKVELSRCHFCCCFYFSVTIDPRDARWKGGCVIWTGTRQLLAHIVCMSLCCGGSYR